MPYLSEIQHRGVFEPSGTRAGTLADLAILPRERLPAVEWAVLAAPDGERILPWSELIAEVRHFRLRRSLASLPPLALPAGAVRLARDLLDRPIAGPDEAARVVSDLRLEESGGLLRLTGVDVGVRGLLRRIGAEGLVDRLTGVAGRRLAHRIVAWPEAERQRY